MAVCLAITNWYFVPFSGTPLVIEGALENWPAINWTLESLKEKVGGNEVNVRVNTNCEEYRVGVILLLQVVTPHAQDITLQLRFLFFSLAGSTTSNR